jgi:hypothetical protein
MFLPHKSYWVSITKVSRLIPLANIIPGYSDNHTKEGNTHIPCEQTAETLTLKQVVPLYFKGLK